MPLDNPSKTLIISQNHICKYCEEDEYAPQRRHREQGLGESLPAQPRRMDLRVAGRKTGRVTRAGVATVIKAKGITGFSPRTRKSEAGFVPVVHHNRFFD